MSGHNDTGAVALAPIGDDRLAEIETELMRAVGRERDDRERRERRDALAARSRRRRAWTWGVGAAAAVTLVAMVAPYLGGGLTATGGADAGDMPGVTVIPDQAFDQGALAPETLPESAAGGMAPEGSTDGDLSGAREIVATASAVVEVDDATAAAATITVTAEDAGGYVETMSIGATGPMPAQEGVMAPDAMTTPTFADGWITVRVPADRLSAVTASLGDLGAVTSSQIDRRDVTGEAVDLRARVEALEASVARLTTLLADADSTADLVAAESALAQRQAELASLQQQLQMLDDQVAMSALTVTLIEPEQAVEPDPTGFGDGIAAGWNGLLATLNGLVVALGFLLPWIAIGAVVVVIVLVVRRLVRRRGAPRSGDAAGGQPQR
ncbi:DUF4349 domain-containing protein [Microbacterium sp. W1N]|uniref:DUF4349 domain-containing protein n=1 Tax=Microbacterium festucae TaxID=2977531 RepID=UPI0021BFA9AA|nr:DUF4349 domain-containing protein [Microbacterium festucae]MCT9820350.1 DUF4349 domain-containing protein [Microbacterium festucae]